MCRIISFVSAKGGVGKTSTISMLALELARHGKLVCVFDGMFAFNDIALSYENHRVLDFSEYLAGNLVLRDVLGKAENNLYFIKTNDAGFDYIRCGELIRRVILDLSESFDYILIDVNALDTRNLNLFLSVSTETFLIVNQERVVIAQTAKLLKRIEYYKNITNIKIIINKFKIISALKNLNLNEEDIASILGKEIIFCFPLFYKYNIFRRRHGMKFVLYSQSFFDSVEKNDWIKVNYKKAFMGAFGRLRRLIYNKFEQWL